MWCCLRRGRGEGEEPRDALRDCWEREELRCWGWALVHLAKARAELQGTHICL